MDGGSWHCTGGSDQDHPQEKEMQKGKVVFWRGLRNSYEKKKVKGKGEKERYTHMTAQFHKQQGEIRKPYSVINAKK